MAVSPTAPHPSFAHPSRNVVTLGVEPGMHVADFGSGSGAYAFAIAEALCGSGRVFAVDIQHELLRKTSNEASRRGLRVLTTLWGDVERPQGSHIADDSLELVLISNLLFQVEHPRAVLAEAKRVLRPRGRLAVIDWSKQLRHDATPAQSLLQKEDVLEYARGEQLVFVKEFAAGAHHYGLLFRKQPPPSL